jgi:hypothetical protein
MSAEHIFISHTTADDVFVKELREKLELLRRTVWANSRNLVAGNKLAPEIEQAIRDAQHFIAVLTHAPSIPRGYARKSGWQNRSGWM